MVRPSFCDKSNVKKGTWDDEDDVKILGCVSKNGNATWTSTRKTEIRSGLKRCGKSCRLRWSNANLRSDFKYDSFSQQEEELIVKLHAAIGSRWNVIAQQLPGRTENDIKNHWNTKLKKKLTEMGIDPVTHKPFSQILADYGSIGGISRTTTAPKHMATLKKDFKKITQTSFNNPSNPTSNSFPSYSFAANSQAPLNVSPSQDNNANNNSHSLALLSQLQAISLVTEGSNPTQFTPTDLTCNFDYNQEFFSQISPNPSSFNSSFSGYSSSYNTMQVGLSTDSFSWHDFLLDDEFEKGHQIQVQQQQDRNDSEDLLSVTQYDVPVTRIEEGNSNGITASSSSSSSSSTSSDASLFLEAMLDQENDMFLNFPGLMDEPLY